MLSFQCIAYVFSSLSYCQFVGKDIWLFVLQLLCHHTLYLDFTQNFLLAQNFIKFVLSKFSVSLLSLIHLFKLVKTSFMQFLKHSISRCDIIILVLSAKCIVSDWVLTIWGRSLMYVWERAEDQVLTLRNSMLHKAPIRVDAIIWIWCNYFYLLSVRKVWFKPLTSYISNSITI
jgi:hypothetical protein